MNPGFEARHVRFSVLERRGDPSALSLNRRDPCTLSVEGAHKKDGGTVGMRGDVERRGSPRALSLDRCDPRALSVHKVQESGSGAVGIGALGLMLDDCILPMSSARVFSKGDTMQFVLARSMRANGWRLTTSSDASSADDDPVRFLIHVSSGLSESVLAGKTLDDCLQANGWAQKSEVAVENAQQKRERVVRHLAQAGEEWCGNGSCDGLSEVQLLDLCLPPTELAEEDWQLVSSSSWRWRLDSLLTVVCVLVFIFMCVCICVYIYMYLYVHVCTYICMYIL